MQPVIRLLLLVILAALAVALPAAAQINLTLTSGYGKCTTGPTLDCKWQNSNDTCEYGAGEFYGGDWSCTSDMAGVVRSELVGCSPSNCKVIVYTDRCSSNLTIDNTCSNPQSAEFYETKQTYPACGCSC